MANYSGKTMLFLGGFSLMIEPVEWAKEHGMRTIVADYIPGSPAKAYADEAWDISTIDTELLAQKCREAGVDGVFSTFDDFNITTSANLSAALGIPFYTTANLAKLTMEKSGFKAICKKYGVTCTPDVDLDATPIEEVPYPVIIKPVDSSGSRGIVVCHSADELQDAVEKATAVSRTNRIICERYIVGDEVTVNYIVQDGKSRVSAVHDRYLQEGDGMEVRLPLAYVYPSKYAEMYVGSKGDLALQAMFAGIGLDNGSLFLQGCVEDSDVYWYEMGLRLNGAKQYHILERENGFNSMEALMHYSLYGTMSDDNLVEMANPFWSHRYCTLSILIRPGKISKIVGIDKLNDWEHMVDISQWLFEGDSIGDDALGTERQIVVRITLVADTLESLASVINETYDTFDALDEDGNSMIVERFDTARMFV